MGTPTNNEGKKRKGTLDLSDSMILNPQQEEERKIETLIQELQRDQEKLKLQTEVFNKQKELAEQMRKGDRKGMINAQTETLSDEELERVQSMATRLEAKLSQLDKRELSLVT